MTYGLLYSRRTQLEKLISRQQRLSFVLCPWSPMPLCFVSLQSIMSNSHSHIPSTVRAPRFPSPISIFWLIHFFVWFDEEDNFSMQSSFVSFEWMGTITQQNVCTKSLRKNNIIKCDVKLIGKIEKYIDMFLKICVWIFNIKMCLEYKCMK